MRREKDPTRAAKHRKRFRVIMEIAFMVLGILCSIMPQPYPLLVPIGIGTIRIISNAIKREKEPETAPIVYCNGTREPKAHKVQETPQTQHIMGATAKNKATNQANGGKEKNKRKRAPSDG